MLHVCVLCVCMFGMWAYILVDICVGACVHRLMWRPEVDIGCLFFFFKSFSLYTKTEPLGEFIACCQLAGGIPCLLYPGITGGQFPSHSHTIKRRFIRLAYRMWSV